MKQTNKSSENSFFDIAAMLIEQARRFVGRTADLTMCITYFELGRIIVEEEQDGKARAQYGRGLLKDLSSFLTGRFGRGFSVTTLKSARKFYLIYCDSVQYLSTDESKIEKGQTLFDLFENENLTAKRRAMFAQSYPFSLGWSHYLILIRIDNPDERRFYEIEAAKQQWTFRQLQRQRGSSLYERLALSRNKNEVMRLASEGQVVEKPKDILKNPLVLEFLGMDEKLYLAKVI
jgi:hypothetical protein